MPNVATHPKRSEGRNVKPQFPIPSDPGDIPFTTLEIPHAWNRDVLKTNNYQTNYLKFHPKPLDREQDFINAIKAAIADKQSELSYLRSLYNKAVEGRTGYKIETRLLKKLEIKLDQCYSEDVQDAIHTSDIEALEQLIKEVEEDPLLAHIIKRTTDLEEVKAQVERTRDGNTAKERDFADSGGGRRASSTRRASNAELMRVLRRDKTDGWDHITFNPETGKLNLIVEILFQKNTADYLKDLPAAEFEDEDCADMVLTEVAKVYKIFQMQFDVVQLYKNPYKTSKGVGGNDHDRFMEDLSMSRAKKMIEKLVSLGVPKEAMKPKVDTTERTTVMQFCQFDMAYKHIIYESEAGKITLKKDFGWEKRMFSRDQQDSPDAQFQEPEVAKKIFAEVKKVLDFLGNELDMVIHRTTSKYYDDEHKNWIDELLWNRAERAKEEMIELGFDEEKLESRVEEVGEDDLFGMHFEIVKGMRATPTETSPKKPDHLLEAQGSGAFEFNGKYKPCGIQNDEIKYRHLGGAKQTISKGDDDYWYMCINHDIKTGVYKCRDLSGTNPWKHCSSSNTGLCPVVKKIPFEAAAVSPKSTRTNSVSFQMP